MECIKTTPAPTAPSILTYGDMEGPSNSIIAQWPSRCTRTLISRKDNPSNDHLVQQGFQSLKVNGSKQCFLFRPIGSPCGVGRVKDPIVAGDVIRISLWVRVAEPNVVSFIAGGRTLLFNSTLTCLRKQKAFSLNRKTLLVSYHLSLSHSLLSTQVFQMSTSHYHLNKGRRRWGLPKDDSHMVSRTLISNANEWVNIVATHKVGDDWKHPNQDAPGAAVAELMVPQRCNHYHLRFRLDKSDSDYWLDNVQMTKVDLGEVVNEAPQVSIGTLYLAAFSHSTLAEERRARLTLPPLSTPLLYSRPSSRMVTSTTTLPTGNTPKHRATSNTTLN